MKNHKDSHCLIQQLVENTNLNESDAIKALEVVSEFVKEKLPVLRGNIQSFVQAELQSYRSKN